MTNNKEKPSMEDDEEDDEIYFDPELFVNKAVSVVTYGIEEFTQDVICSTACTTDHDLTGIIVWPISIFLAWFIARNRKLFEHHQVLELGAGCGLAGLVASRFAEGGTLLTDGNDLVLDLLSQNVIKQTAAGLTAGPLKARKLLWGDRESLEEALEGGKWQPQVLLGCDVIAWPDFVAPLLSTIKALFLRAPDPSTSCMYLGFVNRANTTERLLWSTAQEMGLMIHRIAPETFLPPELPEALRSNNKLEMLTIISDPTIPLAQQVVEFHTPTGLSTPC